MFGNVCLATHQEDLAQLWVQGQEGKHTSQFSYLCCLSCLIDWSLDSLDISESDEGLVYFL